MDEEVFSSCQKRNFHFIDIMIKVLFPSLYLVLARKQLCLPPERKKT